jgi:hypothetical protein
MDHQHPPDLVGTRRRVVIDEAPSKTSRRRGRLDPENARLRRAQKPTGIVQKRADARNKRTDDVLVWPAFRNTPDGLLDRATRGDHGARARVLELMRLGAGLERAQLRRAES